MPTSFEVGQFSWGAKWRKYTHSTLFLFTAFGTCWQMEQEMYMSWQLQMGATWHLICRKGFGIHTVLVLTRLCFLKALYPSKKTLTCMMAPGNSSAAFVRHRMVSLLYYCCLVQDVWAPYFYWDLWILVIGLRLKLKWLWSLWKTCHFVVQEASQRAQKLTNEVQMGHGGVNPWN